MKEEKNKKKSLFSTGKVISIATIPAVVTALALVFVTKDSFSAWKFDEYYPGREKVQMANAAQDKEIIILKERDRFYMRALKRIEDNQILILSKLK